jgi:hypothetical protein
MQVDRDTEQAYNGSEASDGIAFWIGDAGAADNTEKLSEKR